MISSWIESKFDPATTSKISIKLIQQLPDNKLHALKWIWPTLLVKTNWHLLYYGFREQNLFWDVGLRTVCVAGNLENEYSEIGTWKQRTDVSQDDLLDTKLWLVSRKSVWSSSSWRPQICQTLRFVVCKTFEIFITLLFHKITCDGIWLLMRSRCQQMWWFGSIDQLKDDSAIHHIIHH